MYYILESVHCNFCPPHVSHEQVGNFGGFWFWDWFCGTEGSSWKLTDKQETATKQVTDEDEATTEAVTE